MAARPDREKAGSSGGAYRGNDAGRAIHPQPPCRVAAAADRRDAIRQVVDINAGRWTAGPGGVSYVSGDRSQFPFPRSSIPGSPRGSLVETMSLAQSATAAPSAPVVAAICAAEILGLAGFSIVPALLPQFIEAWSLTNTQAGWLAGIISAGYMLAVIPLVSLTDRRPARQIYLASSALSALSCVGMALCDSLLPALGFRALAGIAMAGMYMPGLRALTHGVEGATRARIAAWYTSSFTIGASLSFLFGQVGTLLGWRSAFVIGRRCSKRCGPRPPFGSAARPRR
jgi:hypothetical protein